MSHAIRCVVPTLNSGETLDATLLSLRSQREVDVDLVVVDSGSTDDTAAICRRWNVPMLFAEAGNMYRAINVGLRDARTPWLAYVNSDDCLYADSFSRLIRAGNTACADVVYGHCDYTDARGRFVYSFHAAPPRKLLKLFAAGVQGFAQPAAIFHRRLYERSGGFDERFRFCADADFYYRAAAAGAHFHAIGGPPVACFRLHQKQQSNEHQAAMRDEASTILAAGDRPSRLSTWSAVAAWRTINAPHYLIRALRGSLLSSRVRTPRSMEAYDHV